MSDEKSMSVHESAISALKEKLQLNGYFSKLAREGIRPDYGYPENHLPVTTGARMKIVTSFVAARVSHK